MKRRTELLEAIATDYGLGVIDLLEKFQIDSVVPGICTNSGCGYVTEYEPDQEAGWCEECETATVVSAFVLAEMI